MYVRFLVVCRVLRENYLGNYFLIKYLSLLCSVQITDAKRFGK